MAACLHFAHAKYIWKPAQMHAHSYLYIKVCQALPRDRKLCGTSPKSNIFPCPRLNAAGYISICIDWIACLIHNRRNLHKLDINTNGFWLWLSLLMLWHLQPHSKVLFSFWSCLNSQTHCTPSFCPCVQQWDWLCMKFPSSLHSSDTII